MSVAAAKPHSDAVISLLTTAGIGVDRGKPPAGYGWQGNPGTSNFRPYAVVYPFLGVDEPTALAMPHSSLDFPFQVNCVGAVQDQVLLVMDDVRAALVGAVPAVTGRAAYPIYQVPLDRPIARNDAVTPPIHFGVAQFHFRSDPA